MSRELILGVVVLVVGCAASVAILVGEKNIDREQARWEEQIKLDNHLDKRRDHVYLVGKTVDGCNVFQVFDYSPQNPKSYLISHCDK